MAKEDEDKKTVEAPKVDSGPQGEGRGARNIRGEESEQSKIRRGLKSHADPVAGEGSLTDRLKKERKRKRKLRERK